MLYGADVPALVTPDKRIQALNLSTVMWKAASGLLGHHRARRIILASSKRGGHFQDFARHTTSAPVFGDSFGHDFGGDGGLHLTTYSSQLRSLNPPKSSHSDLIYSSASPLEQSLSTLDDALNRVVQFPLFTSPLFQVLPLDSHTRFDQRWCYQLKAIATAAESLEVDDVVEEEDSLDDEEEDSLILSRQRQVKQLNRAARAKETRLLNRQRKLEIDAWDDAVKEYKRLMAEMCRKKLAPNLPFAKSLLLSWFEPVRDRIQAELQAIEDGVAAEDRDKYGPYLLGTGLSPDVLAVLTMHKVMAMMMADGLENGCIKLGLTAVNLGDTVEQEARIRRALKPKRKKKDEQQEDAKDPREYLLKRLKKMSDSKGKGGWRLKKLLQILDSNQPWPTHIQAKVGCCLIEILMCTTHVNAPVSDNPEDGTELRPAFTHVLKVPSQKSIQQSYGAIVCDKYLRDQIDASARFMVVPYMPMLVVPRPWKGYSNGAYFNLRSAVMRTHGSKQQREAVRNTPKAQLKRVFEALDALGATSWKINTEILDVLEHLWKEGGGVAGLVDRKDDPLPIKPETSDLDTIKNWRNEFYETRRTNNQRHSQRCDLELKLNVARKLRDEDAFYYPHNLDFRGRAYPMHAHLIHLGADSCRGMLQFAKGRPLGEKGLDWIKIHIANLYGHGFDKLSFKDRIAFADDNFDSIMDSAERPLDGERWWLQAEDPFQCLAACMDIRRALSSPNVKEYMSHLPVHQDGSCNGLQHYAALSRDRNGARAVNLLPGDVPADVYSDIAARVRAIVEEEAKKDPTNNPNTECARLLLGHVDRKLVKQTVMTSVYGVTYIGAKFQILNRLKAKGVAAEEQLIYRTGCYAAKVTLDALGQMFKEARRIMNWLGDCAKVIAADGEAVRWITPMGLPVVQPYRRPGKHVVKTTLQNLILRTDTDQPVMAQKQRTAFPPNFIHSMDGSHMMKTAMACHEAGLAFAGVHDSFWTHAGDVEQMNQMLRNTFVELYSEPVLENLLESFQAKFPQLKFPPLPELGDLDLEEVRESAYFFN